MNKKVIISILIIVFAFVLLSIFFILGTPSKKLSESEKEKAVSKILGRKANLTEKFVPKGDVEYKGKYLTLIYPARARIYTQKINGIEQESSGLETFIFDLDDPKIIFSMEVIQIPVNMQSLNDYPAVKLRQLEKDAYTQGSVVADSQNGFSFDKSQNGAFEKTTFFLLRGKVYSFSIQGNDLKAVDNLFDKVISSLKFL